MPPINKDSVAGAVAAELPRFFNDTIDAIGQGEGAYLNTGEPKSYISKIGQAVGRSACRQFAAAPDSINSNPATRFERACRPYLNRIGQGQPGLFGPPFRGGQCNGVYTVQLPTSNYKYRITICSSGVVEFEGAPISRGLAGIQGPIQRIFAKPTQFGNCGPIALVLTIIDANGVELSGGTIGSTTATKRIEMTDFRPIVFLSNGLPDNCGNPTDPEGAPIAAPDPTPSPFRYNDGQGNDTDITTNVNVDGTITFNIGGGDVTVNPFPEDDGGGGGGGGGGGTRAPGDQGQPGTPQDVGAGDAAEGDDPVRSLAGVLVQTIATPPRANKLLNPTESYTKGAYFVYLGGDVGLELIDTAAITRPDQYYSAPLGCNRFRVVPNAGFVIRVTPFYLEE